jgi:group I intron endonuclease
MASASGIYCWKHIKSGKRYIGQAKNMLKRMSSHRTRLRGGYHDNNHFQNSWNKYGEDAFEFCIIEHCPEEILGWKEVEWIKEYKSTNLNFGYNLTTGGEEPRHSEETKRVISLCGIGRKHSKDSCKKISIARKGIVFPEKHRKNLSESAKQKWKRLDFREKNLVTLAEIRKKRYILEKFYCA